jgi:polysaccharide biosynthesis/export protein
VTNNATRKTMRCTPMFLSFAETLLPDWSTDNFCAPQSSAAVTREKRMPPGQKSKSVYARSFSRRLSSALFSLCAMALSCAALYAQSNPTNLPGRTTQPEYQIHSGDQLDIKFFYHPELNESIAVRPDGRISLQLVGEVVASGVCPRQLSETLTEIYGRQLKMAEAAVIVRSFSSQKIYVDGEVSRPGVLILPDNMTLLQALAEAGGLTENGRLKNILVVRRADNGTVQVLRGNALYASATSQSDFLLRPYDVVYVPRRPIANVNRWVDQYIRKNIPITFGILSSALNP